ncbi:MAG: helix-turn-helix transcriptional regulator, partial [Aeromonas sp.]
MPNDAIWEFIGECTKASKASDLHHHLEQFSRHMGFDYFQLLLIFPTSMQKCHATLFNNCPDNWLTTSGKDQPLIRDPVVCLGLKQTHPIFWNKRDNDPPWLPDTQRDVMDLAARLGIHDGISFPLHTPQGEHGILSFLTKEKNDDDQLFDKIPLLSLCASYIFNAALTLTKRGPRLTKGLASLSDRERECLFWACEGKTSWEIAVILGIRERTVNFHLNHATSKTGSKNRNQAIAKGITSGMITPTLKDVTVT